MADITFNASSLHSSSNNYYASPQNYCATVIKVSAVIFALISLIAGLSLIGHFHYRLGWLASGLKMSMQANCALFAGMTLLTAITGVVWWCTSRRLKAESTSVVQKNLSLADQNQKILPTFDAGEEARTFSYPDSDFASARPIESMGLEKLAAQSHNPDPAGNLIENGPSNREAEIRAIDVCFIRGLQKLINLSDVEKQEYEKRRQELEPIHFKMIKAREEADKQELEKARLEGDGLWDRDHPELEDWKFVKGVDKKVVVSLVRRLYENHRSEFSPAGVKLLSKLTWSGNYFSSNFLSTISMKDLKYLPQEDGEKLLKFWREDFPKHVISTRKKQEYDDRRVAMPLAQKATSTVENFSWETVEFALTHIEDPDLHDACHKILNLYFFYRADKALFGEVSLKERMRMISVENLPFSFTETSVTALLGMALKIYSFYLSFDEKAAIEIERFSNLELKIEYRFKQILNFYKPPSVVKWISLSMQFQHLRWAQQSFAGNYFKLIFEKLSVETAALICSRLNHKDFRALLTTCKAFGSLKALQVRHSVAAEIALQIRPNATDEFIKGIEKFLKVTLFFSLNEANKQEVVQMLSTELSQISHVDNAFEPNFLHLVDCLELKFFDQFELFSPLRKEI